MRLARCVSDGLRVDLVDAQGDQVIQVVAQHGRTSVTENSTVETTRAEGLVRRLAADLRRAAGGKRHSGDHGGQGGPARSGRTGDRHERAGRNGEADPVQDQSVVRARDRHVLEHDVQRVAIGPTGRWPQDRAAVSSHGDR